MASVRIAFAGLSPLCEQILCASLGRRADIEVVAPWTRLSSLRPADAGDVTEALVIELDYPHLPPALRVMLSSTPRLRIIALAPDARSATVFRLVEERIVLTALEVHDLCSVLDSP